MKKILFCLGGGIGNIIQATPAIQLLASANFEIYIKIYNSTENLENLLNLKKVVKVFSHKEKPNLIFDFQLNGIFTPKESYSKKIFRSKINYAQHIPESKVYENLCNQIGIKGNLPYAKVSLNKHNITLDKNAVAIYPGCKPDWSMKKWDKFDELSKCFENVVLVGTKEDINLQGTWIKKEWSWKENIKHVIFPIDQMAYYISNCSMFIGNDGGLSHVAAATGIKTFIIFGPSSHIKNKPFTKNSFVIRKNMSCQPCQFKKGIDGLQIFDSGKYNCYNDMSCMRELTINDVLNQINEQK